LASEIAGTIRKNHKTIVIRIVVDYKLLETENEPVKIASAKYLSDYVIRLNFTNGEEKLVDFKPFYKNLCIRQKKIFR